MARGHHVEEVMAAGAIEDDLAVAGGGDGDRPLARALERQRHRPVEWRHLGIHVVEPLGPVEAGVQDDRVAGLRPALPDDAPVPEPGAVVRLEQAGEARFLLRALMVGWIDVERPAGLRSLRLGARAHACGLARLSGDAIGIGQDEAALVLGVRLQVENAAREPVRDDVLEVFAAPKHLFPADAHERQRRPPGRLPGGAEGHRHRRVPVRVPANRPFESEVEERRVLDDEAAGVGAVLRGRRRAGEHEASQEAGRLHPRVRSRARSRGPAVLELPFDISSCGQYGSPRRSPSIGLEGRSGPKASETSPAREPCVWRDDGAIGTRRPR